jgi:hypothetical protein
METVDRQLHVCRGCMDKAGLTENLPANMLFSSPCDMCPGHVCTVYVCSQQWIDKYIVEETVDN